MRVRLPFSDYPAIRVILDTPKGEIIATADHLTPHVDIPLPEGVAEEEVDVWTCFLDNRQQVPCGCGPALLQPAARKRQPAVEPVAVEPEAVEPEAVEPVSQSEPQAE